MKIFVTGTDTDVGKTTICSWLCLHTGYSYFKPIQTGTIEGTDSEKIHSLTNVTIHKEIYTYKDPVSPHLAALIENKEINLKKIISPNADNLIVEGAGGLLVPINKKQFIIDLIDYLKLPVILVARSTLGTINHTLLSIETLRARKIPILGVIINGIPNKNNEEAIKLYGKVPILATFPKLENVNKDTISAIPLTKELEKIMR
jgi:dethiobiotin synthetase